MVLLVESSTEMDFWPGTQAGSIHCHGPSSPSLWIDVAEDAHVVRGLGDGHLVGAWDDFEAA